MHHFKNSNTPTNLRLSVLVSALLFSVYSTQAQQSVNASAANASGSGGSVAYSIGQIVYTAHTSSTASMEQGVQHAFEIFTLSTEETAFNISLLVFPNPTNGDLALITDLYNHEALVYELYDFQGRLLKRAQIREQQTPIDMSGLTAASYLLTILNQQNQKVKSFKILKN